VVFVCTFPIEVTSIEKYYQFLGRSEDNRYFYAPRNFLEEFFKINKETDGYGIFVEELSTGIMPIMDTIVAWLGLERGAVVHLTTEEMPTFLELIEMSSSSDVYLNLMETESGVVSLGQHIFLNSLPEIIRRCRDA